MSASRHVNVSWMLWKRVMTISHLLWTSWSLVPWKVIMVLHQHCSVTLKLLSACLRSILIWKWFSSCPVLRSMCSHLCDVARYQCSSSRTLCKNIIVFIPVVVVIWVIRRPVKVSIMLLLLLYYAKPVICSNTCWSVNLLNWLRQYSWIDIVWVVKRTKFILRFSRWVFLFPF